MENINTPMAIIVAGVIVAGALLITSTMNNAGPSQVGKPDPQEVLTPVTSLDYIRGSRDAKVTIVEYSDLECPYCQVFHETLRSVLDEYDEGEVAWVYRHAPLAQHPKAPYEANAAECAGELGGNDVFWAYIDRIFEVTPANNGLDLALLPQFAQELGLETNEFQKCLDEGRFEEKITQQLQNAFATAQALGITRFGTPFSVIVTKDAVTPLQGAESKEVVMRMIEEALK